jgi:hypothetical protein
MNEKTIHKSGENKIPAKIARVSAWALLICVLILVASGWGITQTGVIYKISFGLVDRRTADSIHRVMNLPLSFFFLLHVIINIRQSLHIKNRVRKLITDGFLVALAVLILFIVINMEYFKRGA